MICSSDGTGEGNFTVSITGLSPHNTYYVRAYAVNKAGTGYGEEQSFSTVTAPIVITADVSNIKATTVSCGGDVTDDGGSTVTARGVCWSKSPVQQTLRVLKTLRVSSEAICSSEGTGEGAFTHSITGLTPDTTYYIRAYAVNIIGKVYGDEISFKTRFLPGDINGDGKVDLTDAIIALKILSGIEPAVTVNLNADADNDGKISLGDAAYILRISLGL